MKVPTTLRIDINRIPEQALKEEKHRIPKEKTEGPASPWGLENRHLCLTLQSSWWCWWWWWWWWRWWWWWIFYDVVFQPDV